MATVEQGASLDDLLLHRREGRHPGGLAVAHPRELVVAHEEAMLDRIDPAVDDALDALVAEPVKRAVDQRRTKPLSLPSGADAEQSDLSVGVVQIAGDVPGELSIALGNEHNAGVAGTTSLNPGFV